MHRLALVFVASAVTFFAQPAHASVDPHKDRPTQVVRIADLDLAKPVDQEELRTRVERAARRICNGEYTRLERRRCAVETVAYTMTLVSPDVRHAYAAAVDRRQSFALAAN